MINISMWIVCAGSVACKKFFWGSCECVSILIEIFLSAHIKPTLCSSSLRRRLEWRNSLSSGAKGVVETFKIIISWKREKKRGTKQFKAKFIKIYYSSVFGFFSPLAPKRRRLHGSHQEKSMRDGVLLRSWLRRVNGPFLPFTKNRKRELMLLLLLLVGCGSENKKKSWASFSRF